MYNNTIVYSFNASHFNNLELERKVNVMEESKGKKFSNWMQDNLQAIIIITIALFILFFLIYSYSKKSNTEDAIVDDKDQQEEVIDEIPSDESRTENDTNSSEIADSNSTENGLINTTNSNLANNQNVDTDATSTSTTDSSSENVDRGKGPYTTETTATNQSRNEEGVTTVTASYGESLTHLARKATAQYISENNVQGLTPAHKIYIEDYLRRSVPSKNITPGVSVSFSNKSISNAIDSAKSLNDYQLQHLNGYAKHVSNL